MVVSPVKAIFWMRGLDASGLPASRPKPLTMFSTPGGRMSSISSASGRVSSTSEGLRRPASGPRQFPAASAGASFHVAIRMGKFHGIIMPDDAQRLVIMVGDGSRRRSRRMRSFLCADDSRRSSGSGRPPAAGPRRMVSRIGLPLSQVSTVASSSRLSSMRWAIFSSMRARSAAEVLPQGGLGGVGGVERAVDVLGFERGISHRTCPVTGVRLSK